MLCKTLIIFLFLRIKTEVFKEQDNVRLCVMCLKTQLVVNGVLFCPDINCEAYNRGRPGDDGSEVTTLRSYDFVQGGFRLQNGDRSRTRTTDNNGCCTFKHVYV